MATIDATQANTQRPAPTPRREDEPLPVETRQIERGQEQTFQVDPRTGETREIRIQNLNDEVQISGEGQNRNNPGGNTGRAANEPAPPRDRPRDTQQVSFDGAERPPDPADSALEQRIKTSPEDKLVRESFQIQANQTERISATEAIQREQETQRPGNNAPTGNTQQTQGGNRAAAVEETQAQQVQRQAERAAEQRQTEERQPNPAAVQTEIGQNVNNLI